MRGLFLIPLALVACKETNPDFCPAHTDDPRCGGTGDGGVDGRNTDSDPGIDARAVFGAGSFLVHINTAPQPSVSFNPGSSFDTDANPLCLSSQPIGWVQAGEPAACFVYAGDITIQDGLVVTGTLPLVLVASNVLTVAGTIDAASKSGGKLGPGASFNGCSAFGATPSSSSSLGGGGAGGSFMTLAGDGGTADTGGAAAKGVAAAALTTPPIILRGGCDGQNGAPGSQNLPGSKGHGGGVVYFLAGSTITLNANAVVNVSGSGGGAAGKSSGGGGGGSGGMIVLYAPTINAAGKLVANGGSGSTGASNGAGNPGADPDPNNPTTQAPGPSGTGGPGGYGYAGGNDATAGGNSTTNGAGAGGGGGGYIRSNVPLGGVTASPTPTIIP